MFTLLRSLAVSLMLVSSLAIAEANCLFCQIVNHQAPAKIIAENKDVMVFESIRPMYPSHWIIIPKKHEDDMKSMTDEGLMGKIFMAASDLAKQLGGAQAFNLQVNNGTSAGQTVFHFHVHFKSQDKLITASPKI